MITFDINDFTVSLTLKDKKKEIADFLETRGSLMVALGLIVVSVCSFIYYYLNGLGLAYNDARSHLDIGRRVVENLKPGFAQLGSVWLPLPHFLMIFTIWNDFMWHSGLSGAIQSMVSFVATGCLIYLFLKKLNVGMVGRIAGVIVFATNLNILYIQSTSMTELLLLATMTAGVYELLAWHMSDKVYDLIKSAFWILLSTLIRYDGWFLFIFSALLIFMHVFKKKGYKAAEGTLIIFSTLAGFGIFLWLLWNQLIFKDALYFISGPYSAAAQQSQLEQAGVLPTKHNYFLSLVTYLYAVIFNSNLYILLISMIGAFMLFFNKNIKLHIKFAVSALFAPFIFNVLALYLGQSVLFVQNLNGSWFNVRYGLMMIPSVGVFAGYFIDRVKPLRVVFLGLFLFMTFFTVYNRDIVTIDDALVGASGKNVKEVSGWLKDNARDKEGFVLISVASHDAIVFSSEMPMSRFIHEGTGDYWNWATSHPSKWARWIILRTHDRADYTYKLIENNKEFLRDYDLIHKYPFADIYELKPQMLSQIHTQPVDFANKKR